MIKKICENCAKEFLSIRSKRRFCNKGCARSGSNNPSWKGDNVGIVQVHKWVEKQLGRPERCSKCDAVGKVDLANISQEYKRELTDWEWLCRRCHMKSDGRLDRFLANSNMHNKIPNRKCDYCGKEYWPATRDSKFCSHSCRATHRNLTSMDYKNRKKREHKLYTKLEALVYQK